MAALPRREPWRVEDRAEIARNLVIDHRRARCGASHVPLATDFVAVDVSAKCFGQAEGVGHRNVMPIAAGSVRFQDGT